MDLLQLWLLIRWDLGEEGREQTRRERVLSAIYRLVLSTGYWLLVATLLTIIVSRLS